MSLIPDSPAGPKRKRKASNVAEYTVSEISGALKRTVEDAFGHVRLRGEVSGYRGPHSSGHAYFSLKDDRARIDAVVWRTSFAKLDFKPQEGLEVIATGKLTTYPGSSKYQIVIDRIEPAGAGALMALLDERRRKLEAEGLFAAERKRALPFLPRVIGIVTSPTGAVIRDICHRIADRFPVHLLVWPVRVQGETSGEEVARAIDGFNALTESGPVAKPDLLIVARGGGSLEDLWGFNDEAVVRAAAGSAIPLISAVGHETDWTLLDHAADRRAPTPTGAAEMAVPVRADLQAALAALNARHHSAVTRKLEAERRQVAATARALPAADLLLALPRRRLDEAASALGRALRMSIVEKRRGYDRAATRLSPSNLQALTRDKRSALTHRETALRHAMANHTSARRRSFERVAGQLQPHRIGARSEAGRAKVTTLGDRLAGAQAQAAAERSRKLDAIWRLVGSLSPLKVLDRGYAIVEDRAGVPITDPAVLEPGTPFDLIFAGKVRKHAVTQGGDAFPVEGEEAALPAPRPRRRRKASTDAPATQGPAQEAGDAATSDGDEAAVKAGERRKRAVRKRRTKQDLAEDQGSLF